MDGPLGDENGNGKGLVERKALLDFGVVRLILVPTQTRRMKYWT